jgi:hypothetical protein
MHLTLMTDLAMKMYSQISNLAKRAGAILAFSALAMGVAAQSVPPLINYQGRLTDQTGAPLTAGAYGIQFRLWDDPLASGTNDLIWGQQYSNTSGIKPRSCGAPSRRAQAFPRAPFFGSSRLGIVTIAFFA